MGEQVWVVSELYYPEETSTGHFMTDIAEGLAVEFSTGAICAQPSYSMRGVKAPRRDIRHGVKILRSPSTTLDKDKITYRLVNLVTISLSIFITALRIFRKDDTVLVVTNPPLLPYFTMLACRIKGAKCIVRIDDVYPDILSAAGIINKDNLVYRLLDWLTIRLYFCAERIVTLGRDMQTLVYAKMSHNNDRVQIIHNWADLEEIRPEPKTDNLLLREFGLQDKFIVQWAGNMGYPHDVESLFEAIRKLNVQPDIHFLFIGSGFKRLWLESQVKEKHLKNVTFIGQRPRSDQRNFLNACDIALSSLVSGMEGISVPSRIYNILAAGKPILAIGEPNSEVALVIGEEKVGWVVPPDQPDQIVRCILEAQKNIPQLEQMGKRARRAAETKYSSQFIIKKYIELFHEIDVTR